MIRHEQRLPEKQVAKEIALPVVEQALKLLKIAMIRGDAGVPRRGIWGRASGGQ